MAAPEKFSTGVAGLDLLLWGGWAYDRINMMWGAKSGAKTTISVLSANAYLNAVPSGVVYYIDAEGEFDKTYAVRLVEKKNRGRFFLSRIAILEEVTGRVLTAIKAGDPVMTIVDSIAQSRSEKEYNRVEDDPTGSKQRGTHASGVGDLVFGIVNALNQIDPRKLGYHSVLLLNQVRVNPGIMFGDPEQTTGGNALAHNVTQEISLRRTEILRDKVPDGAAKGDKGPVLGREILATVRKTRVAGRDQEQARLHYYVKKFGLIPAYSFDDAADIFPHAQLYNVLERSGKFWTFQTTRWGSKDQCLDAMRSDPVLRKKIFNETLRAIREQ